MTGTIVSLHDRGFGFIRADDGADLFFPARFVDRVSARPFRDLRVGDRVTIGHVSGNEAWHVRWLCDGEVQAA